MVACAEAKPLVLSSLKPLSLIVQEVAGPLASVDTLLPITASHHDYPMKVSDYTRLNHADLILWVGPELESFLQKPLAGMPPAKLITISKLNGLYWPTSSTPEAVQEHEHEKDPHVWLDPRNAMELAKVVAENLARLDPQNALQYKANLQKFLVATSALDAHLTAEMKPLAGHGFAVYHEGFGHFVQRYGLHELGYVTFTPEQKPGAKHLHQLREKLAKEGECLFLEPQNDQQSLRDLAQELHLRVGTLDIIGGQSVTTYSQLMEQIAKGFSTCLANGAGE